MGFPESWRPSSTVRYTALAPDRFKELLEGLERGRHVPILGFQARYCG
jgi:hypothetical protein